MSFVDSYIVFRVSVTDLKRLKINLKIKFRSFKVLLWPKRNHHSTIKICCLQIRKKRWWEFEYVLHLTEQSDELFANFIQEAVLDRSACSSHSLLFWSNLFNYFSFCLIFGIDSFFEGITNVMTGQYFLIEPFYIHTMFLRRNHIFRNTISFHQS